MTAGWLMGHTAFHAAGSVFMPCTVEVAFMSSPYHSPVRCMFMFMHAHVQQPITPHRAALLVIVFASFCMVVLDIFWSGVGVV
jgi:hypothetical protein